MKTTVVLEIDFDPDEQSNPDGWDWPSIIRVKGLNGVRLLRSSRDHEYVNRRSIVVLEDGTFSENISACQVHRVPATWISSEIEGYLNGSPTDGRAEVLGSVV